MAPANSDRTIPLTKAERAMLASTCPMVGAALAATPRAPPTDPMIWSRIPGVRMVADQVLLVRQQRRGHLALIACREQAADHGDPQGPSYLEEGAIGGRTNSSVLGGYRPHHRGNERGVDESESQAERSGRAAVGASAR
jgi:hypothetical protein